MSWALNFSTYVGPRRPTSYFSLLDQDREAM